MSSEISAIIIVILAGMLVIVSACTGALWYRLRSAPAVRALQLARDLADRQRALEALIDRLEATRPRAPRRLVASGQAADHPMPATRPTLIAVPDLAQQSPREPTTASTSDLVQRFGSIWQLADEGAGPESIARLTGQPIGQVELILGLRRHLGAACDAASARPLA